MDQQTALVRRNQWVSIINASQARPKGTTVRQWLQDNSIRIIVDLREIRTRG